MTPAKIGRNLGASLATIMAPLKGSKHMRLVFILRLRVAVIAYLIAFVLICPVRGVAADIHDFAYRECYSIQLVGPDKVCIRLSNSVGERTVRAFEKLWTCDEDKCALERTPISDGEEIVLRRGERFGRHSKRRKDLRDWYEDHGLPAAIDAIYIVAGSDLPKGLIYPQGYTNATLLIAFHCRLVTHRGEKIDDKFVVNPADSTFFDLNMGKVGRFFCPYKSPAIPESGCAPFLPDAPKQDEFDWLTEDANLTRGIEEDEYYRLAGLGCVKNAFEGMQEGVKLVKAPNRASFVKATRVLVSKGGGKTKILGRVEVYGHDVAAFSQYDEKGRVRLSLCLQPKRGEINSRSALYCYESDGSLRYSMELRSSMPDKVFAFSNCVASRWRDEKAYRETYNNAHKLFRSLFGFLGNGELTSEEVKKCLLAQ